MPVCVQLDAYGQLLIRHGASLDPQAQTPVRALLVYMPASCFLFVCLLLLLVLFLCASEFQFHS